MILGIDPKVDYAFKHLLGRESTRPILIDVIDKVLNPAPGHHIQDIELLNPFNPKESADDKLSILDIKARDQSGRQFNVEMQMLAYPLLREAHPLLLLPAAPAAASRGPGLPGAEADHFDQLPGSGAVSAGAGLPFALSPAGAVASLSVDRGSGVPHAGAAEVHQVGGGVDERAGRFGFTFCVMRRRWIQRRCRRRSAAAAGAACRGGAEDVDANRPGTRAI